MTGFRMTWPRISLIFARSSASTDATLYPSYGTVAMSCCNLVADSLHRFQEHLRSESRPIASARAAAGVSKQRVSLILRYSRIAKPVFHQISPRMEHLAPVRDNPSGPSPVVLRPRCTHGAVFVGCDFGE